MKQFQLYYGTEKPLRLPTPKEIEECEHLSAELNKLLIQGDARVAFEKFKPNLPRHSQLKSLIEAREFTPSEEFARIQAGKKGFLVSIVVDENDLRGRVADRNSAYPSPRAGEEPIVVTKYKFDGQELLHNQHRWQLKSIELKREGEQNFLPKMKPR